MSATTTIEWTDRTWNPLRGCTRVSEGCRHCYAERVAWRFGSKPGRPYFGLVQMTSQGTKWTGRVQVIPEMLEDPLHWREPSLIFVNSMSDLFHEQVPDDFIDAVMAVMWLSVRHTYQVLTKRPARARRYFDGLAAEPDFDARMDRALTLIPEPTKRRPHLCDRIVANTSKGWPAPPNLWLGTSVENQETADERIPELLATRASLRWVSAEPLLGAVDLHRFMVDDGHDAPRFREALHWVVAGGESGPHARPMHPDWPRQLRDQCAAAGVPFLFKQHGEWAPGSGVNLKPRAWIDRAGRLVTERSGEDFPKGATSADGWAAIHQPGKKAAGRLLDGVLHDDYPIASQEPSAA